PAFPTPVRHVITVVLENQNPSSVLQQGPFERYLAQRYAFANHYYAVCHPSAPNYLSLTSGEPWQCGSDNYNLYTTTNIADLVEKAGLTWGAYAESMPSACDTTDSGYYAVRHVPFLYFRDIAGNSTRCDSHVLNFTAWSAAVRSNAVPNYAFIAPNKLDDGHDTNISYSDAWLKGWLSPLLNDSFFNSSVFFIVYDESAGSGYTSGYDGLVGGPVYLTAVSPWAKQNFTLNTNASQYSLLETTEWLLGLGSTGHNDSNSSFGPMKAIFANSTAGPTYYALNGSVTAAATGAAIPGATVSIQGGASVLTNQTGRFSLQALNGTYTLEVSAAGFGIASAVVLIAGSPVVHNFSLEILNASLYPVTGSVDFSANASPVPGALVELRGIGSAVTGPNGSYRFLAANGTYALTVSAPGLFSQSSIVVVHGAPVVRDFSLIVPLYPVRGTVTDRSNGSPLADANVTLRGVGTLVTGANGTFRLWAANGTYQIAAHRSGYLPESVRLVVAGAPIDEDFALEQSRYVIGGVVVQGATGDPLAGANVSLPPSAWQLTNSTGGFAFEVPNGSYTIRVTDQGYVAATQNVTVAGQSVTWNFTVLRNGSTSAPHAPSPAGGLSIPGGVDTLAVVTIALVGTVALLWSRRRHRRSPPG
ncbi:MAG: carboxypeptidase regulatory-like domain-containing protein, partial [Thermoplasmata archaeon]